MRVLRVKPLIAISIVVGTVCLGLGAGCGDDENGLIEPAVPRNAVDDLRVVGVGGRFVHLAWTVPEEESGKYVGPFHMYYSVERPVDTDSLGDYEAIDIPLYGDPGTMLQMRIPDVPSGVRVYFGMRAEYRGGELSGLSNICSVVTPEFVREMPDNVSDVTLSPDGSHLAYVQHRYYYPFQHDFGIVVRPSVGLDLWALASGANDPDWSPDGSRLAYTLIDQLGAWVYVESAAGGSPLLVFTQARSPVWSPDGNSLAAIAYAPNWGWSVHVSMLNSEGADLHLAGTMGLEPRSWSPDSSFILCTSMSEDEEIAIIDVDSGEIIRYSLGTWVLDARWSPVASQFAVSADDGIRILTYPTFQEMRLTLSGYCPIWMSSGDEILFLDGSALWSIEVSSD